MPAKKGSTARKPSIKAKSGAKSKAPPKKNASASKKAPTSVPAKKKDPKKSKIPEYLEVPTLEDDDLVVSDEDMQFFEEHGDFTGFLKSMDKKAISKNDAIVKKPVARAPAASVPEPAELTASEDEDSDLDGDDNLPPLSSSEDEMEDVEDEEDVPESDEDMEEDDRYAGSDEEQDYEMKPRKVSSEWTKKDKFTKLPIKLPGGKWEQAAEDEYSDDDEEKEEPVPEIDSELSEIEMEDPVETLEPKKKTFVARKEELAQIASTIMEDPESNIGLLRTLKAISEDKNPKVAQLALLTQLAVYKDIVPGYRIRQLTEKEEAMEVSRDVKKVRAFEQTLLASYQAYLTDLEQISKRKPAEDSEDLEDKNAMVATQCMCQLLTNLTHFNFRLNLMTAVIAKMSTVHWTKTAEICCNAIIEVFRHDETGEASLDAVKLISRMVKSKGYLINESVINTFLHLRLKDELPPVADNDGENMKGKKRPKSNRPHISKKQRKVMKENKEVEKEMKEAEEVVTKEEKDKTHTETLKLVFACYFRVLKHHQTSKLLPAVLEGLAKFAHLISIDFFRDLLEAMKAVMHSGANTEDSEQAPLTAADTRRRLLCSITAFQLLSGQGEALNLDLQDFYTEIYRLLLPMSLDPHITDAPGGQDTNESNGSARPTKSALESEAELLTKGLELMFLKKRHISIPRAAAFIKRFSTSALNMPDNVIQHYLTFVKKLLTREPRLDALVQSEDKAGNGVYLPTLDDPELCNPFATSLYELYLYQNHYDPNIRSLAKSLAAFQPVGKIVKA
ncbi:hypothetical protein K450DRAFT_219372 [Umbelopsis ramanniana AG]|uniref:Nucleolar complex-associated protein 3 n=1 Tax=Umbelopsis ramanniana AG TaxID=1314678 RepID=A0AAD5EI99_UMBRA|nr:uncharacterized protein K450DRAFT_219372 [Umbelopsis ramanniana AG]KAI8584338.1 hypothetical protein K450DRAFT_219372 [Umbelopsis ramanniana AG]